MSESSTKMLFIALLNSQVDNFDTTEVWHKNLVLDIPIWPNHDQLFVGPWPLPQYMVPNSEPTSNVLF